MKQNNKVIMDLFIFRRKEKNITLPLLRSNKEIIKIGSSIGGSILLFVFVLTFVLILEILFNKVKRNNLKPFVEEYDSYILKINNLKNQVSSLEKTNNDLSQAIVNIRSGSSILSEISRIIPSKITLTNINVLDNNLEIKGIANQTKGLEIINLFIIELQNSKFIKEKSVKLISAKSKENIGKDQIKFVNFIIKSEIVDNTNNINKNDLKSLGSLGLSKRIDLIKSKGLLK